MIMYPEIYFPLVESMSLPQPGFPPRYQFCLTINTFELWCSPMVYLASLYCGINDPSSTILILMKEKRSGTVFYLATAQSPRIIFLCTYFLKCFFLGNSQTNLVCTFKSIFEKNYFLKVYFSGTAFCLATAQFPGLICYVFFNMYFSKVFF